MRPHLFFLSVFLLLHDAPLLAQEREAPLPPGERLPVQVEADSLEYWERERLIVGRGSVQARFEGRALFAEEVIVDLERETLMAQGRVVLLDGPNRLEGEQLFYRYRTHEGILHRGKGFLAPATTFEALEIRREGEKRYRLLDAVVTTCRVCQPEPGMVDWELRAKEATIEQDEEVFAKHASFWIRGIPVAYTPYIAFPIGPRRTGFLVPQIGFSNRSDFLVRVPFFWAINESQDATFTAGYRGKRGPEAEVEYRYVLSQDSWGEWRAKYIRDNAAGALLENRWIVRGKHDQTFEPNLTLKADIDYVSDQALNRDFVEEPVQLRTARISESKLFLTQATPTYTFEALLDWSRDLTGSEETRFLRMPDLHLNTFTRPLPEVPLSTEVNSSIVYFERDLGSDGLRFDLFPRLTFPLKPLPWLKATSSLGLRGTGYTKKGAGEGPTGRGLVEVKQELQARFVGRYGVEWGSLVGFDHVFQPRLVYQFIPEVSQSRLPQFDPVDFVSPQNRVSYLLENRLVAAFQEIDGTIRDREVISFSVGQSLNLDAKERSFSNLYLAALTPERTDQAVEDAISSGPTFSRARERSFSNLVTRILVSPFPFLSFRGSLAFNVEEAREDSTATSVTLTAPRLGSVEFGQSAIRKEAVLSAPRQAVEAFIGKLALGPFNGLSLEFLTRYDGVRDAFLEHQTNATYATCCWQIGFRFTNRPGIKGVREVENDFRVTFEIKAGGP